MKLYTQNTFAILPVFLGMILIMGGSKYLTQREEMIWGAKNEIASLAVSVAEFVNPNVLPSLSGKGDNSTEITERFQRSLQRVFDSGYLRHLGIYSGDGAREIYSFGEKPLRPVFPMLKERYSELITIIDETKPFLDSFDYAAMGDYLSGKNENEPDTMVALAPVSNGRGQLAAIVWVEKDVSEIAWRSRNIIVQMIFAGVLILIAGLVTATIVSGMVKRPIQGLTNALLASVGGQWNQQAETNRIREFQDFGNTYNTMISVLKEVEARLNRNLIQREFSFSKENVSCFFREVFFQPILIEADSFSACGSIHGDTAIDFFNLAKQENRLWAFVCRLGLSQDQTTDAVFGDSDLQVVLVAPGECDLDVAVSSASVSSLIQDELSQGHPKRAFEIVSGLFDIDYFHYVLIDPERSHYSEWTLDRESKTLVESKRPLIKSSCLVLHTFTGNESEQINVYSTFFGNLPPKNLMKEILNALGDEHNGAIVIAKFD